MVRRLNNLPQEILLEILAHLPTESALDCKLVCKSWRDLVRHPYFSQMHLNHLSDSTYDDSGSKLSIIFPSLEEGFKEYYYTEYEENGDEILLTRETRMNLSPKFHNCDFLGSCNGLICFNAWNGIGPAYICNPITGEYIVLPDLQANYLLDGFGYSASTNEYKVVRICFTLDDLNVKIGAQVYTVGSGNGWRSVGEMVRNGENMTYFRLCAGAFANGALHWVNRVDGMILAFHLTDEKFSVLPSPPCVPQNGVSLGVLGDVLSTTYYDNHCTSEIWLLKKNKDTSDLGWSKEFCFNSYIESLIEFPKSGRLLGYGSGKICSYDPKSSYARSDVGLGMYLYEAMLHINTLVSLKALGEKCTMDFRDRTRSSEVIERSDEP